VDCLGSMFNFSHMRIISMEVVSALFTISKWCFSSWSSEIVADSAGLAWLFAGAFFAGFFGASFFSVAPFLVCFCIVNMFS